MAPATTSGTARSPAGGALGRISPRTMPPLPHAHGAAGLHELAVARIELGTGSCARSTSSSDTDGDHDVAQVEPDDHDGEGRRSGWEWSGTARPRASRFRRPSFRNSRRGTVLSADQAGRRPGDRPISRGGARADCTGHRQDVAAELVGAERKVRISPGHSSGRPTIATDRSGRAAAPARPSAPRGR